ncbi:MAG: ABC transporter permease [Acidimicrobiia bacterium]|nr:ABC transporter permease [Acidimicrobiia bacterium]
MIDSVRSEWIKLRTVMVNWVLVICAIAFPTVISTLTAALSDELVSDGELAELVAGTSIVTAMLLGVVAAIGVTNEFTHNTIRPTFAATPKRFRPLAAKAAVHVVVTAVVMTATVLVSWIAAQALADSIPSTDEAVGPVLVGVVVLAVGVTLLGFGLGLLIRNSAATVCVILLWPFVVENLLSGLLGAAGLDESPKYMPYLNGLALAVRDAGSEFPGRVASGVYFFAVVLVIGALGLLSGERRDA